MLKKPIPAAVAFGLCVGLTTGCTPPSATVQPTPAPEASATPKPVATTAPPAPVVPTQAEQEDVYKQGLAKAESATNISKSALTEDDWRLVVVRWQQAVQLLKSLPATSPYRTLAQGKVAQFERQLAIATKKVAQAQTARDRSGDLSAIGNAMPLNVTSASAPTTGAGQIFRAPIKRRAGGTPVIDVLFNGNQTFEMIVDTGASSTVITGAMAEAMGVRFVGKTKVNTASQAGVEIPLAYVRSIAVGQAVIEDVVVAVGNEALDIGLLGHDFFSDYDVTVKRDVVEFRKR
mgnify:CR=1 FL=1